MQKAEWVEMMSLCKTRNNNSEVFSTIAYGARLQTELTP